MCGCPRNHNAACGWPPHTVRATIAITLVICITITLAVATVWFLYSEEYTQAWAVLTVLSNELTGIVGWYFGSHSKKDDIMSESHEQDTELYPWTTPQD